MHDGPGSGAPGSRARTFAARPALDCLTTGRWAGRHERRNQTICTPCRPLPSKSRRTSLLAAFQQIGPGLILAASIVGTGELINTTSLGAKAGFSLLWLILLSCVIKVFVQVELGRYAITHGKTTLGAFDSLPGPRAGVSWLCWLWLLMTPDHAGADRGDGRDRRAGGSHGLSRGLASGRGRRRHGRPVVGTVSGDPPRAFLGGRHHPGGDLCCCSPAATAGWRGSRPSWSRRSPFSPSPACSSCSGPRSGSPCPIIESGLQAGRPAGRGGPGVFGVRDHGCRGFRARRLSVLVHRERLCALHRTAEQDDAWAHRARGWTRVMQLDAWFSMVVFTVATVAFYFLGAAVLHPQGLDPKGPEMIPTLSRMYLQPLEGTRSRPSPVHAASASCSGPGPFCSKRSTSPPPPTAA